LEFPELHQANAAFSMVTAKANLKAHKNSQDNFYPKRPKLLRITRQNEIKQLSETFFAVSRNNGKAGNT